MSMISHWVQGVYASMRKTISHQVDCLKQIRRLPCPCSLCHQYHSGHHAICDSCYQGLTPITSACYQCGLPLPQSSLMVCGHCLKQKPAIDFTLAPFAFEEPLRFILHEFKYHQGLHLTSFLAQLIIQHLTPAALQTDCLIPVPMHPERLRQRGFNQAAELTRTIAKQLKLPYHLNLSKKIIPTRPQAKLNAEQRRLNLQNAFQVAPFPHKHVTLIDDLLTTGSTANELARTLKQQGAEYVAIWCCARAIEYYQ